MWLRLVVVVVVDIVVRDLHMVAVLDTAEVLPQEIVGIALKSVEGSGIVLEQHFERIEVEQLAVGIAIGSVGLIVVGAQRILLVEELHTIAVVTRYLDFHSTKYKVLGPIKRWIVQLSNGVVSLDVVKVQRLKVLWLMV